MNPEVMAREVRWSWKACSALRVWAAVASQITSAMTSARAAATGSRKREARLNRLNGTPTELELEHGNGWPEYGPAPDGSKIGLP